MHSSLLLAVVIGAFVCCNVASVGSSPWSQAIMLDDWSELDHSGFVTLLQGGSRSLLQAADPPVGGVMVNGVFELATSRTDRPNPHDHLRKYRGGYNLSSTDYAYSVGYTGLPAFILVILWTILGLFLLLTLCCCCCCCRHRTKHEFDHGRLGFILPLLALIFFSIAAIIGSVLLYYAQGKFNNQLRDTLNYAINQSAITENGLRGVSNTLGNASNIDIGGVFTLSPADKAEIANINNQLNNTANDLHSKTYDNKKKVNHAIHILRIALITVAAVMLGLILLGLLFSACGLRPIVYFLVLAGWLLVIGTWILCAAFIVVWNGVGDTCLAMEEWVANPQANTSLDRFIPCDASAASSALTNSKDYTSQIVGFVNQGIDNVANINAPPGTAPYFNQSGPLVPDLCVVYGPAPDYTPLACPSNTVTFAQAASNWSSYVCTVGSNGLCTTQGRLTPSLYSQITSASNIAGTLVNNATFLATTANCTFVRNVFTNIHDDRCPSLRKWSKWIWIGLVLVSAGSMLSILSWIAYVRRRKYRYKGKSEPPMYKGQSQAYSPTPPPASSAA